MKRAAMLSLAAALVIAGARAAPAAHGPGYLRPVKGSIIRHFEPPPTPFAAGHRGIDLAVPAGTVVRASGDGVVAFAGPVAGELFVSVDHEDGIRTTYSFLAAVTVKKGAAVARGQPVALSGAGHAGSSQPHLHFGARRGEVYLDPEPLLLDGLRRDLSDAIRLAPLPAASPAAGPYPLAASAPARASILRRGSGPGARSP